MKPYIQYFAALTLLFVVNHAIAQTKIQVRINDTREGNFCLEALRFILDKSGREYRLVIEREEALSQPREVRKVEDVINGNLDLMYMGTSYEAEQKLRAIYFPIMRGLIGRRVFMINANDQEKFNSVKTLADLRKHHGIQAIGWMDIDVLTAAGLRQTSTMYDNIFRMINNGRPYYFSRGVIEAYTELDLKTKEYPNLAIENTIVLEYPAAIFFFVNRENTELANTLTQAFQLAYRDGSYHTFMYNHPLIKNALKKAQLQNRISIKIQNPLISAETAAIPQVYWHQNN